MKQAPITFQENQTIASLIDQGLSPAAISREVGRPVETVKRLRAAIARVRPIIISREMVA